MESSVLEIRNDGTEVRLADGSKWSVTPGDSTKTGLWYATQRIKIEKSAHNLYPYVLINLDTAPPDKVGANPL